MNIIIEFSWQSYDTAVCYPTIKTENAEQLSNWTQGSQSAACRCISLALQEGILLTISLLPPMPQVSHTCQNLDQKQEVEDEVDCPLSILLTTPGIENACSRVPSRSMRWLIWYRHLLPSLTPRVPSRDVHGGKKNWHPPQICPLISVLFPPKT